MSLCLLQARVPAPAEPIDLTVEIREEPIEDFVPESRIWSRATSPAAEVVPAVPIMMVLWDGFLQGPGEWTLMDDLDVALSAAMATTDTRAVQVVPLVLILDFAEEEAEQLRRDR